MTHPLLSGVASALEQLAADRAGRQALIELWDALGPGDAAARCILAHFLADAQDGLDDEIAWDETALAESAKISDEDLWAIQPTLLHVAGFMSSLHVNLADGYRRLGRFEAAARHLESSLAGNGALTGDRPEDVAYRDMIVTGQQRVAAAIDARDSTSLW
jgi:hypothetical protein